jgi:uncharacterized protein YdiU (UPF0061 family)
MNKTISSSKKPISLDDLCFDNRFVRELPGDPEKNNFCRQVEGAYYSFVKPAATVNPSLVAYSSSVASLFDLSDDSCKSEQFVRVFSGNELLPNMEPFSMCYGGHQFGNWAGQLGDGRAINLGEVISQRGDRWYLQLKGGGITPYSRNADGLAVLRSSVREFLCSEAMHYLGVPTTRALSLTLTGDTVVRDMFYDGNAKSELGAVVCRVAPSFTRFGNFQLPASRGDIDLVKKLVDYTITTDFSDSFPGIVEPTKDNILQWYKEVSERTLEMVLHWMRVGFVHGVMNTDNMSILGLTIDYGPYGWLENYDPTWTPNTTDATNRRYRFEHQPQIAHWNLLQLANTILALVDDENSDKNSDKNSNEGRKVLEATLNQFAENYQARHLVMQLEKLGLKPLAEEQPISEEKQSEKQPSDDAALVTDLLTLLQSVETDMTLFYRCLAEVDVTSSTAVASKAYVSLLADSYYQPDQLTEEYGLQLHQWIERYATRCESEGMPNIERKQIMNAVNPLYVLRNYLSQVAIDKAENGDFSGVEELMEVLKTPYTEQEGKSHLAQKRPEWARHRAGCSMLSCSS